MGYKLGFAIPMYVSEDWCNDITRQADSLINLAPINDIVFLINLQNYDHTNQDQVKALNYYIDAVHHANPTWGIKQINSQYDPSKLSMAIIRNDTMNIDPNLQYYAFMDDDFKFNEGAASHYQLILDTMDSDPNLGMVMSAGFLGGYRYKGIPKYAVAKHWHTCRGLFIRNLHKPYSPCYSLAALQLHRGGYEEMLVAYEMLGDGYSLATMFNNPTSNNLTKSDTNELGEDISTDYIHSTKVSFPSIQDYLKFKYDISTEIKRATDLQKICNIIYEKVGKR